MTKIIITENYWLDVDTMNYALRKRVLVPDYKDKNGKVVQEHYTEATVGYFSSFESAIAGMLKHNMSDLDADLVINIKDYAEMVVKENKELLEQFKKYGKVVNADGE